MIIFDNLWIVMQNRNVSTYTLREKCGIDSKTIRRLKANANMETKTLNKLCTFLDCPLADIAEYRQEHHEPPTGGVNDAVNFHNNLLTSSTST